MSPRSPRSPLSRQSQLTRPVLAVVRVVTPNFTESEEELNFQDDLRAGAFQFLESTDPDPAPYQAVFGRSTLTWKYPLAAASQGLCEGGEDWR